jgi:hypothetical protein
MVFNDVGWRVINQLRLDPFFTCARSVTQPDLL